MTVAPSASLSRSRAWACVSVSCPFPGGALLMPGRGGGADPAHPVRRAGRRAAAGARPGPGGVLSAGHCGMRAPSAPASRHKAAALRAGRLIGPPSEVPSKMPHAWASRPARPTASSRSPVTCGGLLVPGEVALSGVVPGSSGELGDQEPVSSRRETILIHRARIERASGYLKQAGKLSRQLCSRVAVGSDIPGCQPPTGTASRELSPGSQKHGVKTGGQGWVASIR